MDARTNPDAAVGALIARCRAARDLSQSRLAAHLGVNHGTISRIERGERSLNPAHVGPLSAILGIEGDDLARLLRLLNLEETVEAGAGRAADRRVFAAMWDAVRRTGWGAGVADRPVYLVKWLDGRFAVGRYRARRAVRALDSATRLARGVATDELDSIIALDYADALILAGKLDDADRLVRARCLPVSDRLLAAHPAEPRARMAMARTVVTDVNLAYNRGDAVACWREHRRALPHLRAAADHYGRAKSLFFLALFRFWQGRLGEAERYARRAYARARRVVRSHLRWEGRPIPRWDAWWDLRDAFALSRSWWETATLALLIDIAAADGDVGTPQFDATVLAWTDARRFWIPDLPPFVPRYLWLEARDADARDRHREDLERWLRETMAGGCWNIHADLQIVYGDFLRWAHPGDARMREAAHGAYRVAREIARAHGFALHAHSAERRLARDEPPFPGLAR